MNKQELATKIWATANELRKNIKASEYKDYILGFMFYKYLCDKEVDYLKDLGGEIDDLQDVDEDTKDKFKDGIGYFISYKNLFHVWKKAGVSLGAKDVSEALDDFYLNLNDRYKTVFDKVFSALQTGLTKLGEISGSRDKAVRDIVDLIDFIPPTSRDYDVLGYDNGKLLESNGIFSSGSHCSYPAFYRGTFWLCRTGILPGWQENSEM